MPGRGRTLLARRGGGLTGGRPARGGGGRGAPQLDVRSGREPQASRGRLRDAAGADTPGGGADLHLHFPGHPQHKDSPEFDDNSLARLVHGQDGASARRLNAEEHRLEEASRAIEEHLKVHFQMRRRGYSGLQNFGAENLDPGARALLRQHLQKQLKGGAYERGGGKGFSATRVRPGSLEYRLEQLLADIEGRDYEAEGKGKKSAVGGAASSGKKKNPRSNLTPAQIEERERIVQQNRQRYWDRVEGGQRTAGGAEGEPGQEGAGEAEGEGDGQGLAAEFGAEGQLVNTELFLSAVEAHADAAEAHMEDVARATQTFLPATQSRVQSAYHEVREGGGGNAGAAAGAAHAGESGGAGGESAGGGLHGPGHDSDRDSDRGLDQGSEKGVDPGSEGARGEDGAGVASGGDPSEKQASSSGRGGGGAEKSGSEPAPSEPAYVPAYVRRQKEKEKKQEAKEELDREAIMQNRPELPPLQDAPADLAGLLQARLERIWGLLEMPVTEKLDIVTKFTSEENSERLPEVLSAYEACAAGILAREAALGLLAAAAGAPEPLGQDVIDDFQFMVKAASHHVAEASAHLNTFGQQLHFRGEPYPRQLEAAVAGGAASARWTDRDDAEPRNV